MNKRGEMSGGAIGVLVVFAVAMILIGAFLPTIASSQSQMTNQVVARNYTVTLGAVGTYVDLKFQECDGTLIFANATGDATAKPVDTANFTIVEANSPTLNVKRCRITPVATSSYGGATVNISGTFGLEGYVDDAGGRAIAGNIMLFSGLAMLAFAIYCWAKGGGVDFLQGMVGR